MPDRSPSASAQTLASPGRLLGCPPFRRIRFACPNCETSLSVPPADAALKCRCPECDHLLFAADPGSGKPAITAEAVFHDAPGERDETRIVPRETDFKPSPAGTFRSFTTTPGEGRQQGRSYDADVEGQWGDGVAGAQRDLARVRRASSLEMIGPWAALVLGAAAVATGAYLFFDRASATDKTLAGTVSEGGRAEQASKLEALFDEFNASSPIDDRLPLVRPTPGIAEKIRRYEARYPGGRELVPDTRKIKLTKPTARGARRSFVVGSNAGRTVRFLVEEAAPGRWVFDWESAVGYCETNWEDFVADAPPGPHVMRVVASPDDYYNYEFRQRGRFICVKLRDLHGRAHCWGYALVDSEIGRRLAPAVISGSPVMITVELEFPPPDPDHPGRPRNQVWIREIVSGSWLVE